MVWCVPCRPIPTTMATLYHLHEPDHPYPRPKPITKTTRPSTPRRSHKQTTRHTAKTTHTHRQNPSPKLLDHQPHAGLASNPIEPRRSRKQIIRPTAKTHHQNYQTITPRRSRKQPDRSSPIFASKPLDPHQYHHKKSPKNTPLPP